MKELTTLNNKFTESQNQKRRKKIISHVRLVLILMCTFQYLYVSQIVREATLAN